MSASRTALLPRSQIYQAKKNRQPDHLFKLIHRVRAAQDAPRPPSPAHHHAQKQALLQRRVDAILKNSPPHLRVSQPPPLRTRKWVSPLQQVAQNEQFDPFRDDLPPPVPPRTVEEADLQQVVRVLDINKQLRYCGEYLQVDLPDQPLPLFSPSPHQSRIDYLSRRFQQLHKLPKPRLVIRPQGLVLNSVLVLDEYYLKIMRKEDEELMRMLEGALSIEGRFTLTSYISFYNIFVWQNASLDEQITFVTRLLMGESRERPIVGIAKVIDRVCSKIHIENFSKSLDNFNEVMKKLLFGDDYEYSSRKEYYLTRKALV
jgi:hypothetical protein